MDSYNRMNMYSQSLSVVNNVDFYPKSIVINSVRHLLGVHDTTKKYYGNYKCPQKSTLRNIAHKTFQDLTNKLGKTDDDLIILCEIQDIYRTYFPSELHQLNIEFVRREIRPADPTLPKSLTDDKQNVHDKEINKKNIEISENIIKLYPPTDLSRDEIQLIGENFIDKYQLNFAVFGQTQFTLYQLLCSIITFIRQCEYKDELFKILKQQMAVTEKLCSTGKMGNMVSVIQGFVSDGLLTFSLDENHFMVTHLLNYINRKIEFCDDDKVIDGLLDKNDNYIKFVRAAARQWKIEMKDRFKFKDHEIIKILEKKYF